MKAFDIFKKFGSLLGVIVLIILMMYMSGVFTSYQIMPEKLDLPNPKNKNSKTAKAIIKKIPIYYTAVGTIQSKIEFTISSRITSQIIDIFYEEGEKITTKDIIVSLDNKELKAQLDQAKSLLKGAQARLRYSKTHYNRVKTLVNEQSYTYQQLDQAESMNIQAESEVAAANEKVKEAEIAFSYAKLYSSINGVVAKRFVDPGDLALTGKPLLIIHDPKKLQLVASIREGLISKVKKNQALKVCINSIDKTIDAVVDEIIPSADPLSRTFEIKLNLPNYTGLYPGMYGKVKIVMDKKQRVLIPQNFLTKVGQLYTVLVKKNNLIKRVYVTIGRKYEDRIEILSGLTGDEILVLDSAKGK